MAKKVVKKRELGLGIRALLSNMEDELARDQQKVVKELSHTVAMIPVDQIMVNPFQPRQDFDEKALGELADSIRVHGLIQPITVRRLSANEYQLISGERRFRASRMAELEEIPAYIRLANDQEMLEMALVENIQREDLNAMEIAITYLRLKEECQLTDDQLADRVGKNRSTITNYLRLLKLPANIQEAVKNQKISMGHARSLAGIDDYGLQDYLFRETISKNLSVHALDNLISSYKEPRSSKKKDSLPDSYQNVQQNFRDFFGTRRLQLKLKGDGKGQIVIPFNTVEELNQLLDRIED